MNPDAHTAPLDGPTFEAVYRRLERPIYNAVYRWVWHPEDAHEIVQDAFVRLWRMRSRVRVDTVEPLVWRIALNLASNRRRAGKLRRLIGLDRIAEPPSTQPGADAVLVDAADTRAVRAAVDALPEKLRRVVFLCAFSEMSYAQVAEALQIAPGTVASRRNAAMAKLRTAMAPTGGSDD